VRLSERGDKRGDKIVRQAAEDLGISLTTYT
jgi:hypothetical protein